MFLYVMIGLGDNQRQICRTPPLAAGTQKDKSLQILFVAYDMNCGFRKETFLFLRLNLNWSWKHNKQTIIFYEKSDVVSKYTVVLKTKKVLL